MAEIAVRPVDTKERRFQNGSVGYLGKKEREKTEEGKEGNSDC